mmetsp:Transcript_6237/g.20357  ORF Transcript_6237/g.20357 Transcript_6237/m.20357 type:complete len:243 (-) Transcript_6237:313-1041(-)
MYALTSRTTATLSACSSRARSPSLAFSAGSPSCICFALTNSMNLATLDDASPPAACNSSSFMPPCWSRSFSSAALASRCAFSTSPARADRRVPSPGVTTLTTGRASAIKSSTRSAKWRADAFSLFSVFVLGSAAYLAAASLRTVRSLSMSATAACMRFRRSPSAALSTSATATRASPRKAAARPSADAACAAAFAGSTCAMDNGCSSALSASAADARGVFSDALPRLDADTSAFCEASDCTS